MSDQLQDLLKRVYEEGVAKANAEAEKIIGSAKAEAAEIIAKATDEAELKLKEAEKKAAELQKNTYADLQMATNHTISAVKQRITDLILDKALDEKIREAFNDHEMVKKIIFEALSAWKANAAGGSITISENMRPALDEFYLKSLKELFDNKLEIDFSPTMKNGFVISPQDGTYKLSFTDEDFANLFKSYLRPRTKELLFES